MYVHTLSYFARREHNIFALSLSKNLTRYRSENNFVGLSKYVIMSNAQIDC